MARREVTAAMALANKSTETKDTAGTNSKDTAATEDDEHAEAIWNHIRGSFLYYSPSYSSSIITWYKKVSSTMYTIVTLLGDRVSCLRSRLICRAACMRFVPSWTYIGYLVTMVSFSPPTRQMISASTKAASLRP